VPPPVRVGRAVGLMESEIEAYLERIMVRAAGFKPLASSHFFAMDDAVTRLKNS
jgi:hypothetical protein